MRWRADEVCYQLEDVVKIASSASLLHEGKWVPARPLPGPVMRQVFAAFWVLVGRADAFVWPEDQ